MANYPRLSRSYLLTAMTLAIGWLLSCRSAQTAMVHLMQAPSGIQHGITLYTQGNYAEAEVVLRDQAGADAKAYLAASIAKQGSAEAQSERKQTRYAEAEGLARVALDEQPAHAIAVQALGESLVGQNKIDDAIAQLSQVLAAKNDVAYAYYWRGKAYNIQRQTARMVDDFQNFLRLAPSAPEAAAVRQLLAALQ